MNAKKFADYLRRTITDVRYNGRIAQAHTHTRVCVRACVWAQLPVVQTADIRELDACLCIRVIIQVAAAVARDTHPFLCRRRRRSFPFRARETHTRYARLYSLPTGQRVTCARGVLYGRRRRRSTTTTTTPPSLLYVPRICRVGHYTIRDRFVFAFARWRDWPRMSKGEREK